MGSVRSTLVDASLGERRELLVRCLLLVERLLEEIGRFGVAHDLCPRNQRPIGGHLVVFSTLTARYQARIHRGLVEVLLYDVVALFDDAGDPVTVFATYFLIKALEHLFETLDLSSCFLEVVLERGTQVG
jgi:hypothetical protein